MRKRNDVHEVYTKYYHHKTNAASRNIPFLLTFAEWCMVWLNSGHWHERGKGRDRYCMARNGDTGPYAIGNVRICRNHENGVEQYQNLGFVGNSSNWFGGNSWTAATPEQRAQRVAALSERMKKNVGKNSWAGHSDEERTRRAAQVSVRLKGANSPWFGKSRWANLSDRERQRRMEKIREKLKGRRKPITHGARVSATLKERLKGRRGIIRNGKRAWVYPGDADYPREAV